MLWPLDDVTDLVRRAGVWRRGADVARRIAHENQEPADPDPVERRSGSSAVVRPRKLPDDSGGGRRSLEQLTGGSSDRPAICARHRRRILEISLAALAKTRDIGANRGSVLRDLRSCLQQSGPARCHHQPPICSTQGDRHGAH